MEFPTKLVVAASCAIHRLNDGFYKKFDDEVLAKKKKSNSNMLYKHFFEGQDIDVSKEDHSRAEQIIEYLQGLGFKALERKLTDFETNVLNFVKSESIGKDKIGIAASLPKVYLNKLDSDTWQDRENELGRNSNFIGNLHERGTFDLIIEYVKFIPRTGSYLITANCKGNIVKFFAQSTVTNIGKIEASKTFSVTAYVKSQSVSNYTGFNETMLNRIKFVEQL
jgi:hypothetical protein